MRYILVFRYFLTYINVLYGDSTNVSSVRIVVMKKGCVT